MGDIRINIQRSSAGRLDDYLGAEKSSNKKLRHPSSTDCIFADSVPPSSAAIDRSGGRLYQSDHQLGRRISEDEDADNASVSSMICLRKEKNEALPPWEPFRTKAASFHNIEPPPLKQSKKRNNQYKPAISEVDEGQSKSGGSSNGQGNKVDDICNRLGAPSHDNNVTSRERKSSPPTKKWSDATTQSRPNKVGSFSLDNNRFARGWAGHTIINNAKMAATMTVPPPPPRARQPGPSGTGRPTPQNHINTPQTATGSTSAQVGASSNENVSLGLGPPHAASENKNNGKQVNLHDNPNMNMSRKITPITNSNKNGGMNNNDINGSNVLDVLSALSNSTPNISESEALEFKKFCSMSLTELENDAQSINAVHDESNNAANINLNNNINSNSSNNGYSNHHEFNSSCMSTNSNMSFTPRPVRLTQFDANLDSSISDNGGNVGPTTPRGRSKKAITTTTTPRPVRVTQFDDNLDSSTSDGGGNVGPTTPRGRSKKAVTTTTTTASFVNTMRSSTNTPVENTPGACSIVSQYTTPNSMPNRGKSPGSSTAHNKTPLSVKSIESLPAYVDKKGRCARHPNIKMFKKKLLGGYEILHDRCPTCIEEAPYESLWRERARGNLAQRNSGLSASSSHKRDSGLSASSQQQLNESIRSNSGLSASSSHRRGSGLSASSQQQLNESVHSDCEGSRGREMSGSVCSMERRTHRVNSEREGRRSRSKSREGRRSRSKSREGRRRTRSKSREFNLDEFEASPIVQSLHVPSLQGGELSVHSVENGFSLKITRSPPVPNNMKQQPAIAIAPSPLTRGSQGNNNNAAGSNALAPPLRRRRSLSASGRRSRRASGDSNGHPAHASVASSSDNNSPSFPKQFIEHIRSSSRGRVSQRNSGGAMGGAAPPPHHPSSSSSVNTSPSVAVAKPACASENKSLFDKGIDKLSSLQSKARSSSRGRSSGHSVKSSSAYSVQQESMASLGASYQSLGMNSAGGIASINDVGIRLSPHPGKKKSVTIPTAGGSQKSKSNKPEFDKKTGRCKKHPSVKLAKKSKFRKNEWDMVRDGCPFCIESKTNDDGCNEISRKKMNALLGGANCPTSLDMMPKQQVLSKSSYTAVVDSVPSPHDGLSQQADRVSRMPYSFAGGSGWYTGQVNSSGKPHGQGRLRCKTGNSIEGEWYNGLSEDFMERKGRMESAFGTNVAPWKEDPRNATSNRSGSAGTQQQQQQKQQQQQQQQQYQGNQYQASAYSPHYGMAAAAYGQAQPMSPAPMWNQSPGSYGKPTLQPPPPGQQQQMMHPQQGWPGYHQS